jgi:hypothetical protein
MHFGLQAVLSAVDRVHKGHALLLLHTQSLYQHTSVAAQLHAGLTLLSCEGVVVGSSSGPADSPAAKLGLMAG